MPRETDIKLFNFSKIFIKIEYISKWFSGESEIFLETGIRLEIGIPTRRWSLQLRALAPIGQRHRWLWFDKSEWTQKIFVGIIGVSRPSSRQCASPPTYSPSPLFSVNECSLLDLRSAAPVGGRGFPELFACKLSVFLGAQGRRASGGTPSIWRATPLGFLIWYCCEWQFQIYVWISSIFHASVRILPSSPLQFYRRTDLPFHSLSRARPTFVAFLSFKKHIKFEKFTHLYSQRLPQNLRDEMRWERQRTFKLGVAEKWKLCNSEREESKAVENVRKNIKKEERKNLRCPLLLFLFAFYL